MTGDAHAPNVIHPLSTCLPKIGVVVESVEKISPLAAAQANQRCKPTGMGCIRDSYMLALPEQQHGLIWL